MASKTVLAAALTLALTAGVLAAEPALRVGTSDDYPPFSLHGRGFDVDVAQALARDLGARIAWVRFRWPELRADVAADRFDVAMSGITWRPERAVIGWMSRAVAQGGPCIVGNPASGPIAVNRGGVLESWARRRFTADRLVAIDDNLSLPMLLAGGAVGAFVTDSFELSSRPRPAQAAVRCEPERDRKVYWIAPARAAELGPRIDRWLAENEGREFPVGGACSCWARSFRRCGSGARRSARSQVCERHAGANGPIARSSTKAARNTVCSSKWGPIICTAVGIRSASMPLGTESAGCPVRFSGAVL